METGAPAYQLVYDLVRQAIRDEQKCGRPRPDKIVMGRGAYNVFIALAYPHLLVINDRLAGPPQFNGLPVSISKSIPSDRVWIMAKGDVVASLSLGRHVKRG